MRSGSAQLQQVLMGSFDAVWECDIRLRDVRLTDVPLQSVSPVWDSSSPVEGSGSLVIVWSDDFGSSLKPSDVADLLAPFGARITLFVNVIAGAFEERVQMGVFKITSVPNADDFSFVHNNHRYVSGSVIAVDFKDLMIEPKRDRFARLSSPTFLSSVYQELGDLTGFAITKTVADAAITRSVVYEQDRVKAVQDVAAILNSIPFMQSDGTLSLRPVKPSAVVAALIVGELGTLVRVGSTLDSEQVYNGVIIRAETDGQNAILAERWITSGPLVATRPGGPRTPYHRVPFFYSSPFITTQVQAESVIDALLQKVSNPRAAALRVGCVFNPLLQVGDVVTVFDEVYVWTIRLTQIRLEAPAMTVEGDVLGRVIAPPGYYVSLLSRDLPMFGVGEFGTGGFGT